jgi:hypothetical protein
MKERATFWPGSPAIKTFPIARLTRMTGQFDGKRNEFGFAACPALRPNPLVVSTNPSAGTPLLFERVVHSHHLLARLFDSKRGLPAGDGTSRKPPFLADFLGRHPSRVPDKKAFEFGSFARLPDFLLFHASRSLAIRELHSSPLHANGPKASWRIAEQLELKDLGHGVSIPFELPKQFPLLV